MFEPASFAVAVVDVDVAVVAFDIFVVTYYIDFVCLQIDLSYYFAQIVVDAFVVVEFEDLGCL